MSNKTWGGRFKKPLHPLVAKFNASLSFDYQLYPYDILGSKAHAQMLAKQGFITDAEMQLMVNALNVIGEELDKGIIEFDYQFEDIHMLIEHLLIQKIGDVGKKLHTGRSRNDQVALDLRLYTKDAVVHISNLLQKLLQTLHQLSTQHAQVIMPGYTHLQQAQPINLSCYFQAYHNMFARDLGRFNDLLGRMDYSPLGAGALAGSTLPLDRQFVADTLGFAGFIENTLDAVSDRDFVMEFCAASSITMVHISRLAEDLILWATTEFNFLQLDDAFATGSSLMPNKKNPDVMELMRGKSGRVFGNLMAILTVMKGLPLAYNKDMQEDKEALFDTVDTLKSCLELLPKFLESITFNTQLMAQKAQEGFLNATALLEQLVLKGVPFRDAHHQVGTLVAQAIAGGKTCF